MWPDDPPHRFVSRAHPPEDGDDPAWAEAAMAALAGSMLPVVPRTSLVAVGAWAVAFSVTACGRPTRTLGPPDEPPKIEPRPVDNLATSESDTMPGASAVSDAGPSAPPLSDVRSTVAEGAKCVVTMKKLDGCDFEMQACINGRCRTCGHGTKPLYDQCARTCSEDTDCARGLVCVFVTGSDFVCQKPAPKKTCQKGHIWLASDGECWKTCKTDHDCPKDLCCLSDPNAPVPICMGKCF